MASPDPSSYSRPDAAKVVHMDFDWLLDFSRHVIKGSVELKVDILNQADNKLILDSRDLTISGATLMSTGQKLDFEVGEADKNFGSKVTVTLPIHQHSQIELKIDYETSPHASGLQWLSKEQTPSGLPFLYSQFQAIHARSAFPCQDTPSVKSTYSAKVRSSVADVVILMSSGRDGKQSTTAGDVYKFCQSVPIPSYLVAIAAGDLHSKDVGPRSKVWTFSDILEKSAYEFGDIESMLETAESICGPYKWSNYDLLILPPSFPYGGMENPNLTFVTPTLLAGDRSLTDVVIHEISHSWTGNLVTNTTFEHFWLNEGFTMFLERKILGKREGNHARHLDAALGYNSLKECIKVRGAGDMLTALVPNLDGVDPDDAFSSVPYEKGHALLWYLESQLGEDDMNSFLRSYIDKFAYQSINTDDFKNYLYEYFHSKTDKLDAIDWNTWFNSPGMPPVELKFDRTPIEKVEKVVKEWISWDESKPCPFNSSSYSDFSVNEKILFLSMLVDNNSLPILKLEEMERVHKLFSVENCEIRFGWLRLGLMSRWEKSIKPALEFVNTYGRMKYTRPIYRDLYAWPEQRQKAIDNFQSRKSTMMQCSVQGITKDLHLE